MRIWAFPACCDLPRWLEATLAGKNSPRFALLVWTFRFWCFWYSLITSSFVFGVTAVWRLGLSKYHLIEIFLAFSFILMVQVTLYHALTMNRNLTPHAANINAILPKSVSIFSPPRYQLHLGIRFEPFIILTPICSLTKSCIIAPNKSRCNWSKCNGEAADGLQKQERGDCLHPFILLENLCARPLSLLKSVCLLCNGCHPLFLNLWPPFVALFDFKPTLSLICSQPSFLSYLFVLSLSGMENKVGLFVQLVPATSLILWTLSDHLFVASFLQQRTISGILNGSS